ncbi:MAG: M13 family metallopeptidase [Prevotellaceae bacterium]|jgi:putative endopeptidase|nr:M13 family metallopeptidase [Prevotellaceae bacterium]
MMMKKITFIIAIALMVTACNSKKNPLGSGIDVTNLDTATAPGIDFYQYACGGWMQKNPLTGEYSIFGTADKLSENNKKQLNDLITEIASAKHENGKIEQKIGDIYNMAMDSTKLNADGYSPIVNDLNKIAAIKSKSELLSLIPELMLNGVSAYFVTFVDADAMNSSMNILQFYQGGISLGQRDYYLDKDENTTQIREKYKQHVVKMFELTGFSHQQAQKNMEAVMKIETRLATAAYDNVKLRDPYANYNKISFDELKTLASEIDWDAVINTLNLKDIKEVNVSQREALVEANNIIANEPLENNIAYLQWKLIDAAATCLSDEFYAQNFDFYEKTLSGKEEQQPRWKRAVNAVNGILGEAVGQMYVKKYFPPEAKERMLKLVHNLQNTLGERIKALEWMSDSTKTKALEKLNAFYIKIGYPDKWRDYSKLEIKNDSYYENIKRATQFEYDFMFAKAGKPVDKDEWGMTPQTVNAYYNPSTNEICFPAGILQYPFFDMSADDAFNYGAIGVVIGHEMTHGFDDQGRQFDKDGNLKDWWTAEDAQRFEERAKVLSDYYDSIYVAPDVHANGRFTLGENIADYGGLRIAHQAYKLATKDSPLADIDGFTPDQRFFLAYANVWAGNIRHEGILMLTKIDPHSLGKWRVNGQMPHFQLWYDTFNISEDAPMALPLEKRASIW